VRTKPVIGQKVWFGPRRLGWGLEPVSIEGWIVTVIMVVLSVAARRDSRAKSAASVAVPLLVATAVLKGTTPGGPKARRALAQARAADDAEPQAAGPEPSSAA
jgi:hypothetical protein